MTFIKFVLLGKERTGPRLIPLNSGESTMSFADPLSITVAGSAKSMPRVQNQGLRSVYKTNDTKFTLTISHQESGTRVRSLVRVDQHDIVPDPLTSVNAWEDMSIQIVFDRPLTGFTSTQVNDLFAAIKTAMDSTFVGKIYGEES